MPVCDSFLIRSAHEVRNPFSYFPPRLQDIIKSLCPAEPEVRSHSVDVLLSFAPLPISKNILEPQHLNGGCVSLWGNVGECACSCGILAFRSCVNGVHPRCLTPTTTAGAARTPQTLRMPLCPRAARSDHRTAVQWQEPHSTYDRSCGSIIIPSSSRIPASSISSLLPVAAGLGKSEDIDRHRHNQRHAQSKHTDDTACFAWQKSSEPSRWRDSSHLTAALPALECCRPMATISS